MLRVEDKYVIPKNDFYELHERVRSILEPDIYSAEGGYSISSLYFDDISDTDYFNTVMGNPCRRKHRIRIYNNSLDLIKLEVKQKSYNRIEKATCPITRSQLSELQRGNMIEWGESKTDPRSLFNEAIAGRHLMPKVIVNYTRAAYVYEAGNTRITFDSNIRASDDIESFGAGNTVYDYPDGESYVLEVKYDEFIPGFILQALEIDSMRQTSYSKYRVCRDIYIRG